MEEEIVDALEQIRRNILNVSEQSLENATKLCKICLDITAMVSKSQEPPLAS